MKFWFLVPLSIFPCLVALGQASKDTTIIQVDNFRHDMRRVVYIDHGRNSEAHQNLAKLQLSTDSPDSSFFKSMKEYREKGYPMKHLTFPDSLPRYLCPLHFYRDSFYLYDACDGIFDVYQELSDSALIFYTFEGAYPACIDSFWQIDRNTFDIRLHTIFGYFLSRLHILDWEKQIVLIEEIGSDQEQRFALWAGLGKAHKFGIIVNDCQGGKSVEYAFPDENLGALLR